MNFEGKVIRWDPDMAGIWVEIEKPDELQGSIARGRTGNPDRAAGLAGLTKKLTENSKVKGNLSRTQEMHFARIDLIEEV